MLAIRCQFLQGSYQASDPTLGLSVAEWPPHPARLHAALVASAWAFGDGDHPLAEAVEALRWLEAAGPPAIVAPPAESRSAVTVFVPRNPVREELSRYRRDIGQGNARQVPERGPRSFPATVVGDEPVWFVWRTATDDPHARVLEELVREVQWVGSSRSPVCCDLVGEAPEPTLVPVPGSGITTLRVAVEGFTEALLERRWDFPPSVFGGLQPYGTATARPDAPSSSGPFDELVVLRFVGGFPLTVHHAAVVTRALRAAVLAQAGDGAPAVLHGHGADPHVAFLALPDVGHPHATGALRGVALALPGSAAREERDQASRAAHAVRTLAVDRRLALAHLEPGGELRALQPAHWMGPARRWRTVTPLIVDRHPKTSTGGLEGALRIAFQHAHLPQPDEITATHVPQVPGAAPTGAYRGDLPRGPRLHVEAVFAKPLRGPVLVGRGRYFGVGLFLPCGD